MKSALTSNQDGSLSLNITIERGAKAASTKLFIAARIPQNRKSKMNNDNDEGKHAQDVQHPQGIPGQREHAQRILAIRQAARERGVAEFLWVQVFEVVCESLDGVARGAGGGDLLDDVVEDLCWVGGHGAWLALWVIR